MDNSLEVIQRKESLLRTLRGLKTKAEGTLQRCAPLLSFHRGLGMVTPGEVQRLCQSSARLGQELDDLVNRLRLRQNQAVGRLGGVGAAPGGVHVAADGTVYVSSNEEPRVTVLSRAGNTQRVVECATPEGLFLPEDVSLTRAGMVVATDFPGGKLRVFNPHSRFGAGEWIGLGDFTSPRGVALDSFGRLLVADYQPGRVHVFGLTSSFGVQSVRAVPGLSGPRYVCGTPDGGFAVSEECGDVKVYDANHKLLHTLGKKYGHSFGSPAGVCVDAEGSLLVSDEQRRCVVLFPASGSPVPVVSEGLRRPAGLACCNRGRLYVADAADHCVKVFQYRGEKHRRKDTSPDPSPSNREA